MLTADQMLYAYALARVTPGQVDLYVAAIGYMLFGFWGAVAAILAIAVPSYMMIPLMRGLQYFRNNQTVQRSTLGLAATSVGLILSSTVDLGRSSLTAPVPWMVFVLALGLLWFTKWPTFVSLGASTLLGVGIILVQQAL